MSYAHFRLLATAGFGQTEAVPQNASKGPASNNPPFRGGLRRIAFELATSGLLHSWRTSLPKYGALPTGGLCRQQSWSRSL